MKYPSLSKAHVPKCRWPKYSAAGDPPSQFTTLGRRHGSGGTEPPLAGREYLNPQSSAPRRTPELERERDVFPFILPHKAFIVACGQRGRGRHLYWCWRGNEENYYISNIAFNTCTYVQHDICGCCAEMGFIVRHYLQNRPVFPNINFCLLDVC